MLDLTSISAHLKIPILTVAFYLFSTLSLFPSPPIAPESPTDEEVADYITQILTLLSDRSYTEARSIWYWKLKVGRDGRKWTDDAEYWSQPQSDDTDGTIRDRSFHSHGLFPRVIGEYIKDLQGIKARGINYPTSDPKKKAEAEHLEQATIKKLRSLLPEFLRQYSSAEIRARQAADDRRSNAAQNAAQEAKRVEGNAKEWEDLKSRYRASELSFYQDKYESNTYYIITGLAGQGFAIAQSGDDYFVASWDSQPFAICTFQDASIMESLNLSNKKWCVAIGQFVKFENFPLVNGSSQRFPVFECVALRWPDGSIIQTMKE